MRKFISKYKNPNKDKINTDLINRKYDRSIVDYIVDTCRTFEKVPNIKILSYNFVTDESKIDNSEYIAAKARSKMKNSNIQRYMHLENSRCNELEIVFQLTCDGEVKIVKKRILVPIPDRDGYYTIKGTRYILMYQIVDNSTYTTKKNLTLKSLMPVSIFRDIKEYTDTEGQTYSDVVFSLGIGKRDANILSLFFAKMGVANTLKFFSLDRLVRFVSKPSEDDDSLFFGISSKMFIQVNKMFFNKYHYVRRLVFMILSSVSNRLSFDNLEDKDYWITSLGATITPNKNNQYDKGLSTLTSFDRMLDDTTKYILKVEDVHKQNIFSILRWMIMEFDNLCRKDNLNLNNRRLRCNEYIAALLTKTFSDRINPVIAAGKKITMDKLVNVFKFQGDILINQLHKSNLLRFDDRVNDLDIFSKLKVTMKGPNSLGGTNANNITAKFRGIHPSYIGKIDLNVCGTSDPGTSAILTPTCETNGLYFDNANEPESFKYEFDKDIYNSIVEPNYDNIFVKPSFDTLQDYFRYALSTEHIDGQFWSVYGECGKALENGTIGEPCLVRIEDTILEDNT